MAVRRELVLVRAPAELGRLAALADEAVDRPGVDELVRLLAQLRELGIALGDVHRADAEIAHQPRPVGLRLRRLVPETRIAGHVEERLLEELRDEAGIGALGDHGGRAAAELALHRERALAQRVVGALAGRERVVEIGARPGLDAGVEVEGTPLAGQPDERHRADVDREVEEEIANAEDRLDDLAIVVGRDDLLDELDAVVRRDLSAPGVGGDDDDAVRRHVEMAQDQRQHGLADASATDHDELARQVRVDAMLAHGGELLDACRPATGALATTRKRQPAGAGAA